MIVSSLRPGHHPDAPPGVCNVRKVERDAGLDALGASIASVGLLAPLVIVKGKDGFGYVVDGNRRFAAIEALVAAGTFPTDADVPVFEKSAELAREVGLTANIIQASMHDADRVEAFAELRRAGVTEKAIAAKFGQPLALVRKLLALGGVSPAVLDAWRAGKVSEDTVKVFTMAPHADQDRVLKGASNGYGLYPHSVRRELGLDQSNVAQMLTYVGGKAYKAEGGVIIEDLFGGQNVVSDPALLKRLADERLEAECERRRTEGWSWVAKDGDLPSGWHWSWPRVKAGERPLSAVDHARYEELHAWLDSDDNEEATDEQIRAAHDEANAIRAKAVVPPGPGDRARSGCVIELGRDGKVEVTEYVIRPEDVPAVAPKDDKPAEPEEKGLPNSLVEALCATATEAMQATMASSPTAGLVALLAGSLCANPWAAPMKVRLDGVGAQQASFKDGEEFPDLVARFSAMSVDELLAVAAVVAARGVQTLYREHGSKPGAPADRPAAQALMGLPDPARLEATLRERFDGEAFFKSAPKAITLAAIAEVLGEDEARRVSGKKKGELVAYATASLLPTGWLPRELRHPGYSGPGVAQPDQALAAAA